MKALLISLVAVTLVGGLVGGGLFAYFSDTETSTGNTFTAGTIDIDLAGDIGMAVHGSINEDFKPCQTGYLIFQIENVGQNPADVWKLIKNIDDTGGILSEPEEREEEGVNYDGDGVADDPIDDISTQIKFDLWIDNDADPTDHDFDAGVDGIWGTADDGDTLLIHEDDGWTVATVANNYIYLGVLEPGETMNVVQSFHLSGDAGNVYQGDECEFDEDYYAQQTVGGVSPPANELPGWGKADGPPYP